MAHQQIGEILKYAKDFIIMSIIILSGLLFASKANAYSPKQLECIARNVYHESRGEGTKGMLAVAYVTLNRAKSGDFPSTPCEVVFQANQFSWVRNRPNVKDKDQYEEVKQLVKGVVDGKYKDVTNGALYFNSLHKKPRGMDCTVRIGNHSFYKPRGD